MVRWLVILISVILANNAYALDPVGVWNLEVGLSANSCGIGASAELSVPFVVRKRPRGGLVAIDSYSGLRYRGRTRRSGLVTFSKGKLETIRGVRCETVRKIRFSQTSDTEAILTLATKVSCPGSRRCRIAYEGLASR